MEAGVNSITINGVEYIPKGSVTQEATSLDGMPYRIVRTYSAGVFAGYVESRDGQEVVMRNVRRLWYWNGAASLSQMAVNGVSKPNDCKFSVPVDREELTQAIEILSVTDKARKIIEGVKEWKA